MATVYDEGYKKQTQAHSLTLSDRKRLTVSGVEDVESFDEQALTLYTGGGMLTVKGGSLKIEKLSTDGGELAVEGRIDSLEYSDAPAGRRGFLSRLLS
ncbi:MAG: YabP/YqfC family sporulation protein [Oscillospiraceae bacterium]|nr:YabP/YqfC family sporulation protein [Oscillospiraceae bacterium]